MCPRLVTVVVEDNIAIVTMDNPPVNATSTNVRSGLMDAIHQVIGMNPQAAVLICNGKTFIAGGDMSEFDVEPVEPHLPDVVQALEDSPVPFIAAMHGTVLGGGLEIAMGCAWRLALDNTFFGMPEVSVGLIPGAGGTQRLPRLVGIKLAIDMCANGKRVSAHEFSAAGGLDRVVAGELRAEALKFTKSINARPAKLAERVVSQLDDAEIDGIMTSISRKAKGRKAPVLNAQAVLWSWQSYQQSQPKERALHLELRSSHESRALRHAFFAERSVAKPSVIRDVPSINIQRIVVVGGGLMGCGIATAILNAGLSVTLLETDTDACDRAKGFIEKNLESALTRGLISSNQKCARLEKLTTTIDYGSCIDHDLAIEAVFEEASVKQAVFKQLADHMSPYAILATNTSYLDPQRLFEGVSHPQRCIGLHFFSPAHIMKLLEVVYLPETSAETISSAFLLAKMLRKTAVLSGICDGFIGNRILAAYRREAEFMLADGVLPDQVDQAMREFGMAMGPFEAQDMGGLQIAWANRKTQVSTRNPEARYVTIADQLCERNRFGQRSGQGWYDYPAGPKSKSISTEVVSIIEGFSAQQNITRTELSNCEITNRLVAVMANEGALIVEEGIAENVEAIDVVKLNGYGFPRWRGGLMHYALEHQQVMIEKTLERCAKAYPKTYTIAATFSGKKLIGEKSF